MNRNQKIVVTIGVALVVFSGVFPPFEGELRRQGDNRKTYMGHRLLFVPPSGADVYRGILGRGPLSNAKSYLSWYSSRIVTSQVWVQVVTVVIATAGLALALGDRNKRNLPIS